MSNTSVIADQTDNYGAPAAGVLGAVMLVNVFTPKEGKAEAFVEAQTAEYRRLRGQIAGWVGNRLGRSVDGTKFVNVAVFESLSTYNAWRGSPEFATHLDVIRPFIAEAAPGMYEIIYSAGDIP
jgi:heme-degrading monooxygenase HmoA